MSVLCPYCDRELEIDHDDGYGYEEDEIHIQECKHCKKSFTYTTSIMYLYRAEKADCLNGSDHEWEPVPTAPTRFTKMRCKFCDEKREPTSKEWEQIYKRFKENEH